MAFYCATLCASAIFAKLPDVCLAVRLLRSCIVSRRLRISSHFFLGLVAPHYSFFDSERRYPIPREPTRGGPKRNLMLGFLLFMHTSLTQNYRICRGNSCGEGLVFRWSAMPHPKGATSQPSPIFLGSILLMRTPFVAELPNLTW